MKLLIMIPAYNEQASISRVVGNLIKNYPQYDYIVINDASNDNTEKICREEKFNYLSIPVNLGIGGGIQTGYKYALANGYDAAVQYDGDGQHDAKYIDVLLEPIKNDQADVVIGSRFIKKEGFQSTFMRRFGIRFLSVLTKICAGVKVYDVTSGFRAANRKMIEIFANDYAQDFPEPEAVVTAALYGARISEVSVVMIERKDGKSSINTLKSVYYMIKVSIALVMQRLTFKKEHDNVNNT